VEVGKGDFIYVFPLIYSFNGASARCM